MNLLDLILVAVAMGATPDGDRWNSDADVYRDGVINILDLLTVARDLRDPECR